MEIKLDLHVHTCYSHDGLITPEELIKYTRRAGLDGVAVTDHNRVDGALKLAKKFNLLIIPGIEVSSDGGHIIGLNVSEPVPSGLSMEETIEKIHKLGGIAIICHPYSLVKSMLKKISLSSKLDAIEVINASAFPFNRSVNYARQLAINLKLPQVAGSDAHYAPEIGSAYTIIDSEKNPEDILRAIQKGLCKPVGKGIPLKTKIKKQILRLVANKL
ncbi:MAG: CehA/McbA family metallohydrolase [Candidatus Bathyarchaeia archaeon]